MIFQLKFYLQVYKRIPKFILVSKYIIVFRHPISMWNFGHPSRTSFELFSLNFRYLFSEKIEVFAVIHPKPQLRKANFQT